MANKKSTTTKKNTTKKTTPKKVVKKEEVKVEEPIVEVVEAKEKKKIFTKKNIIIFSIALVILIIAIIFIIWFTRPKNVMGRKLKSMGKEFYTEYFYDSLKEGRTDKELSEVLEQFKDTGISMNLSNLSQYSDGKFKKEIDSFKNCDKEKTEVIIYPKKSYRKKDFKIKINFDCKF